MSDESEFFREEPAGYGGSFKPSPVLIYPQTIEAAHQQGNDTEHMLRATLKRPPSILNWNKVHVQCRQEICFGANVSEKMADKSWEELDLWLQLQLADSVEMRWKGRIQLRG